MILSGLLTVLLALAGTPLFVIVGAAALLAYAGSGQDSAAIGIDLYRLANQPMLISIPLFAFSGYLLAESGAPRRLVRLSRALLGWLPGGLAIVALVACAVFTALTGASGVTIIALGGLLFPFLRQDDYGEHFSLGLLTSSSSLGLLFPPSLPLIIYGVVSETSIDQLFLAGLTPGLFMLLLLAAYSMAVGARQQVRRTAFSFRELAAALWEARGEAPLPFLILGGIYSGQFAISEAAAITAVAVLFVEVVLYRDIPLRKLTGIINRCMVLVGAIMIIMGIAMAYTNYLVLEEVPMKVLAAIQTQISSPISFLIALNIFLLIVGCMMDIFSALVVVVPLIAPIAASYGIHPVHLGIIFLANLEIGYITPPIGLNLFIASYRFQRPVPDLFVSTLPFFAIRIASLLVITYVPLLSLWPLG
jgi:tripartite ATP-independent transporter DctM subunit